MVQLRFVWAWVASFALISAWRLLPRSATLGGKRLHLVLHRAVPKNLPRYSCRSRISARP